MRLLVVTSRFPYPLEKGDKLRIFHQIEYLSRDHDLTLVSLVSSMPDDSEIAEVKPFCKEIHLLPISPLRRIYNLIRGYFRGWPLQVSYFYDYPTMSKLRQLMIHSDFDHVYCQLVRTAEYVKGLPMAKTIDYMDTLSAGIMRRSESKRGLTRWLYHKEGRRLQKYEARVFKDFDHHTIISDRDRMELPENIQPKVEVIPNGINTAYFAPDTETDVKYDLVFVGNMGYEPNVEAAIKLVSWCDDLKVNGRLVTVLIAGARPSKRIRKLDARANVTVSGWVEDIRKAYASASIFAAPVFTGAGLQNKILESMGMGIPCISTTMVNDSIQATVDKEILIANSSEAFKKAVIKLLDNEALRNEIAGNARTFVENNYSWNEFNARLEDVLMKPVPKYGYHDYRTEDDNTTGDEPG